MRSYITRIFNSGLLHLQRFKPLAGYIRREEAPTVGELRWLITPSSDICYISGPLMMTFCPTARKGSRWLLCGWPGTQTHLPLHKNALQLCSAHRRVRHRHSGKFKHPPHCRECWMMQRSIENYHPFCLCEWMGSFCLRCIWKGC